MSNVIKVTVMEGADLLAVDKGGTSDPFCVVTLLDFMDEPFGKPQKTKTIRKTLTPQWKQSFAFTLPPSAVGCKLRLEVFDHDKGFLKNAPVTALGATHLSLAMLQPGTSQDNWFALERWGEMSEVSGKVRVLWARPADGANKRDAGDGGAEVAERRDTLNVDASLASLAAFEVGMSEEEKAKKEAEAAKAGLPPGVDISVTDPYPKKPPNELTVVLMRASGLRVMDKSLFGRGSSDPYVVFECDGETAKSTVKRKCLDPVYIETFTFPAFDAHANLTLTVFDHDDLGKDDFMGKYEMRMDALRDKRLHREVVKLRDANGVLDGDRGEVEVFLAWRTNGKLIVELPTSVTSLITSADAYADCDVNELTVVVIRATRLLAMDSKLFGGAKSSDPYLALECDGMKIKTNHKPKTTKPVWLEVVRIPVDRYAHAWLECKVFDHDLVGNDDFMGKVRIDLADFLDRRGRRKWYTLTAENGKRDEDRGRVELYTIWRHSTTLKLDIPTELASDAFPFVDDRYPPTELTVFVARAKGLEAVDVSLLKEPSSDPYVVIECEGQKAQTSVKKRTLAPTWKEILKLAPVEDVGVDVTVSVWDSDIVGKDDFMGSFTIPLKLLANKAPVRRWIPLGGSIPNHELERAMLIETERPATAPKPSDDASVSSLDTFVSLEPASVDPAADDGVDPALAPGSAPAPAPGPALGADARDHAAGILAGDYEEEDDDRSQNSQSSGRSAFRFQRKRRGGQQETKEKAALSGQRTIGQRGHEKLEIDGTRSSKHREKKKGPVKHSHSPLEFAEFCFPSKRLGNVDVWLAWRHNPEYVFRLPAGVDVDPMPRDEPNEVTCVVIRAKYLVAVDKSFLGGATSDPLVALKIGDGVEVATSTKKKELFPRWQETLYLSALKTDATELDVTVWDVDEGLIQHELPREFMGGCRVNLAKHRDFPNRGLRHWYPLLGKGGAADGVDRGALELYTAFRHNPDLAVVDVPEEHEVDAWIGKEDPNDLSVVVIRGKGLAAGDGRKTVLGTTKTGGAIRPYVTATLGSWAPTAMGFKVGASPVWLERFRVECDDWETSLVLVVKDKNRIETRPDVVLGRVEIPVRTLAARKAVRKWYKLGGADGKTKRGAGDLDVCLHWRHSPDVKGAPVPLETHAPAPEDKQLNQVKVHVIRCRGLKPMDAGAGFGATVARGTSDPRVRVSVGNLAPQETATITKQLNPDFDELLIFDDVYDSSLTVSVVVEDVDDGGRRAEHVGKATIPVRNLAHRKPLRKWFVLENKKGRPDPALGKIELALRWCYNQYLDIDLPEESKLDAHRDKPPNELFVVLIRARNLPPVDKKVRGRGLHASSDPYVRLECVGKVKKSSTKKKTLNPRWVERLSWDADDATDVLTVEVRDSDVMSGHDLMGRTAVAMDDLKKRMALRRWFPLTDEKGARDKERGDIELLLHWRHNPDMTAQKFKEEDAHDHFSDKACNALQVVLIRAKKLKALDKYLFHQGGTTDPVCSVIFHDEKRSSVTKHGSLNPEWAEKFQFNDVDHLDSDTHYDLMIEDVDTSGARDLVGRVRVFCAPFKDRKPHRRWYWLEGENDPRPKEAGKVELITRWVHDPSIILPCEDEDFVDEHVEFEEANEVTVYVIRARKLLRMSRTHFTKDTSNPLIRVSSQFESRKTKVARMTVHPQYGVRYAFEMRKGDDGVVVEALDAGESGDDPLLFMGKAKIDLKTLAARKPVRAWLTLGDERYKKDMDAPRGQVEVVAFWRYNAKWKVAVPNDTEYDNVPDGPCNQLCVCVLRAWNVLAMNCKSNDGSSGASDPYCVVRCNGQEKTTETIDANVHPVWLSTFKFLAERTRTVELEVWDYDALRKNKFIGIATFPLSDLAFVKKAPTRTWLRLKNRDGLRDKRRGSVEVYMHWHTSLKLFRIAAEHDDVAHLTEDGRVEYAGGEVVRAPKRPTGHSPEQLVVAVLKVSGLSSLALNSAVQIVAEVDGDVRRTAPLLATADSAYFQDRFHFDVEAWEGAGYWDGPPLTLSVYNSLDASADPDWSMPVASRALRTPTLTLRERRTVDLGNGVALDCFLWWRHLEDPHLYRRPKPLARIAAAPAEEEKAARGDPAPAPAAIVPAPLVADRLVLDHRDGLAPLARLAAAGYDSATESFAERADAVEIEVVIFGCRGIPAMRFVELETSVGVRAADASAPEVRYGSYETPPAASDFETRPSVGAKFADAAYDSRETLVVAPSTVLNFTVRGEGMRLVRRYATKRPLKVLGFASFWVSSHNGAPASYREWLPLRGGSLSGDDWCEDRGEIEIGVRVLGRAHADSLNPEIPRFHAIEPPPPLFGSDAPALRDVEGLPRGALAPLVLPETFRLTGRNHDAARTYRRALARLPLDPRTTDPVAKRRLVEQHLIRAAGHAIAKRLVRASSSASALPPPGRKAFTGGFSYPADAPDPRRPPATYPETQASIFRAAAGARTRDFYLR